MMFAPGIPLAPGYPSEADSRNISARNEYASARSEAEFNRSFANAISVNTPHQKCCAAKFSDTEDCSDNRLENIIIKDVTKAKITLAFV